MKNKKAVSIMVAYVLLIIIAIILSILVYTWLKKYIPKYGEECDDNVALVIDAYGCNPSTKELDITVRNSGLFSVSGLFIRISNDGGIASIGLEDSRTGIDNGKVFVPLKPGEVYSHKFSYAKHHQITNIEIEPFIIKNKQTVLCSNAIVNIPVGEGYCNGGGEQIMILTSIIEDGYIQDTELPCDVFSVKDNSDTVFLGGAIPASGCYRSYIQFDTSSIPDSATITNTVLNLFVSITQDYSIVINSMEATVIGATNNNIVLDIADGVTYATHIYDGDVGYAAVNLGETANSYLQANLINNYFSVGLKEESGTGIDYVAWNSSESANPPQLIVTYLT